MIVLTGLALGLAISAKWTTLAAYGTIIVILALRLTLRWTRYDGATGGVAQVRPALPPALAYGFCFLPPVVGAHPRPQPPPTDRSFFSLPLTPPAGRAETFDKHAP